MSQPRTIAIVNQKGGTGKTTTAVNLGRAITELGHRVLLLDLDQQASLTYSLGIGEPELTIVDWLSGKHPLDRIIHHREDMDIVSSGVGLADYELGITREKDRHLLLKSKLQGLEYDYILMDCAPSLSLATVNALSAATDVIIPMQLEVLSLHGLNSVVKTIKKIQNSYNPQLKILGILFSMVDASRSISAEIYHLIKSKVNIPIFSSRISIDEKVIEAPSFGKSVLSYSPDSLSSCEFRYLADEVTGRIKGKEQTA